MEWPDGSGFDWWVRSPLDGGCGLTAHEWQVWMLLARDASHLEIASRLSISVLAARLLVHDVLAKLGVCSQAEAAALARTYGLQDAIYPGPAPGKGPGRKDANGLDATR